MKKIGLAVLAVTTALVSGCTAKTPSAEELMQGAETKMNDVTSVRYRVENSYENQDGQDHQVEYAGDMAFEPYAFTVTVTSNSDTPDIHGYLVTENDKQLYYSDMFGDWEVSHEDVYYGNTGLRPIVFPEDLSDLSVEKNTIKIMDQECYVVTGILSSGKAYQLVNGSEFYSELMIPVSFMTGDVIVKYAIGKDDGLPYMQEITFDDVFYMEKAFMKGAKIQTYQWDFNEVDPIEIPADIIENAEPIELLDGLQQ